MQIQAAAPFLRGCCFLLSGGLPRRIAKPVLCFPVKSYIIKRIQHPLRRALTSNREESRMSKLLRLLEADCTLTHEQLASMAGMTVDEVRKEIKQYEDDKVILGYKAIVDWDRTQRESVTALIEVKVTPQRGDGFDRVAERIYQYDEVESVYLMSGAYDLTVIISGRTLKEVAQFVGERLSTLEDVTGTATHFILRKYKEKHLIFERQEQQEKEWIFS